MIYFVLLIFLIPIIKFEEVGAGRDPGEQTGDHEIRFISGAGDKRLKLECCGC